MRRLRSLLLPWRELAQLKADKADLLEALKDAEPWVDFAYAELETVNYIPKGASEDAYRKLRAEAKAECGGVMDIINVTINRHDGRMRG